MLKGRNNLEIFSASRQTSKLINVGAVSLSLVQYNQAVCFQKQARWEVKSSLFLSCPTLQIISNKVCHGASNVLTCCMWQKELYIVRPFLKKRQDYFLSRKIMLRTCMFFSFPFATLSVHLAKYTLYSVTVCFYIFSNVGK